MADRIPDEIVSEIISPLLKLPDQVFSDTSAKPLTAPGYSSSTYLLVCKSWLRIATPQADALSHVLLDHPEIGQFIRKLRVEGGFGTAMLRILKSSPNITDLFLSLLIWGSDSVAGLCEGLLSINPRRVILLDGRHDAVYEPKPMKNREVTNLLKCLAERIPKWDKMKIFHLPYVYKERGRINPLLHGRGQDLASVLAKSRSLQTLVAGYLVPISDVPSLKRIRLKFHSKRTKDYSQLAVVPKVRAVLELEDPDSANGDSPGPLLEEVLDWTRVKSVEELQTLSRGSGLTVESLTIFIDGPASKKPWPATNPAVLAPFITLKHLHWSSARQFCFSMPTGSFTAIPNLVSLKVQDCAPSVLDFFTRLSFDHLRIVDLREVTQVASAVAFVRRHGSKLIKISATLEILVPAKVFDVCANLETAGVLCPTSKVPARRIIPNDFFTYTVPHSKLTKIQLDYPGHLQQDSNLTRVFQALDTSHFPALKSICMPRVSWPKSEKQVAKNDYVGFSELLRPKGIKLTDEHGLGWAPRATR
ncbi:hypothetical protein FB45DRAFT_915139 [Roridomyces roridus]|uniref:Uncharacterized protein n=1 Tax=Roridomyces roridus TaxID=1738132 RepID=A0AAD7BT55_9AGAR|nr:hypothetical protein FB45DRAFT_915139 [Roridomyces roridus]